MLIIHCELFQDIFKLIKVSLDSFETFGRNHNDNIRSIAKLLWIPWYCHARCQFDALYTANFFWKIFFWIRYANVIGLKSFKLYPHHSHAENYFWITWNFNKSLWTYSKSFTGITMLTWEASLLSVESVGGLKQQVPWWYFLCYKGFVTFGFVTVMS